MTRSRNLTWVVVATAVLMVASTNLAGAWHHEDTPLHLAQNKLLEEAGADDAWTTPAEEHACYKGISYLTSGKNVAKLGPRIVPLLYDSLIDERYLNQHEVTDANGERVTVQAYTANGKFGYRYCIWLVAVRILSDQIYDDMREKFIVHLTGIAGTPRPSYHGAGFCDIILYESMETLGAFPSDTANDALLRVMRDQTKKDEARVYAAGFLVNCKVPVISNEAKQYILSEYENSKYPGYPLDFALWEMGDYKIRKELVERYEKNGSASPLVFHIYESDPESAKRISMKYLDENRSGDSLVTTYYPLVVLEFLLEHYPVEELGIVWVKEQCLKHAHLDFLGYSQDWYLPVTLRWMELRKRYFPELEKVEIQMITEKNRRDMRKLWEPYIARDPFRIIYTIDKETGEVVLGAEGN